MQAGRNPLSHLDISARSNNWRKTRLFSVVGPKISEQYFVYFIIKEHFKTLKSVLLWRAATLCCSPFTVLAVHVQLNYVTAFKFHSSVYFQTHPTHPFGCPLILDMGHLFRTRESGLHTNWGKIIGTPTRGCCGRLASGLAVQISNWCKFCISIFLPVLVCSLNINQYLSKLCLSFISKILNSG